MTGLQTCALPIYRAEHVRERFTVSYERLQRWGMESVAVVPLLTETRCVGALSLMAEQADAWSGVPPILLEEIAASIAVAVDHCAAYEELGRLRRSEEHTSELQSRLHLVCRLLLEKKKNIT